MEPEPGSLRPPLQRPQTSIRSMSISFSTPKTASSNVVVTDVRRSFPRRGALGRARGLLSKAASEEGVEYVSESTGANVETIEAASAVAADGGMSEAVIGSPLARVGENLVRLVYFLEAVLGSLTSVAVGMEFEGQLPKRLLDVFLSGVARNV